MKYLQLLALMVLAISASASVANISQKATDVAKQFLTQKAGLRSLPQGELTMAVMQTTPDKAVKLKKGKAAQADYYAYNVPNGGFVLMAPLTDGEIKVVGYSIDSNFEFDNAPDALVAWLTSYKEAVATRGNTYPHPTVKPVTPILTTKWGQGDPYNRMCPKYDGNSLLAGCTAVAMAQIMYHYKSTAPCQGKLEYVNEGVGNKELSVDFSKTSYDWGSMLPTYDKGHYTDAQANAVAKLMYEAGVSCKARYDVKGTMAMATSAALPFVGFNYYYNYNCDVYYREWTPTPVWIKLIQDELTAGRPILYSGASGISAHAFVIDGIDAENNVHINWGWEGQSDGYYDVTYCHAPEESRGYFKEQLMLTGIRPRTSADAPYRQQLYHMGYNYPQGQYMKFCGITANNYEPDNKYAFTVALEKDGELKYMMPDKEYDNTSAAWPAWFSSHERNLWHTVVNGKDVGDKVYGNLADGTYELQVIYRTYGSDGAWTVLPVRDYAHCTVTVTNGDMTWNQPFDDEFDFKGTITEISPVSEMIGKTPMYLSVTYQDESNRLPGKSANVPLRFTDVETGDVYDGNGRGTATCAFEARYPGLVEQDVFCLNPKNEKSLGMPGGTYKVSIGDTNADFKLAKDFTVTLKPAVDYPILDAAKDVYTDNDVFYWGSKVYMHNPAGNNSVNKIDGNVNLSVYAKSVTTGEEVRLHTFTGMTVPALKNTSFFLPTTLYPLEGDYELSMRYTTPDGERGLLNPEATKKIITIRPLASAALPQIAATAKDLDGISYLTKGEAHTLSVPVANNASADFSGIVLATFYCKETGSYVEAELQNVGIKAGASATLSVPVTFPGDGVYAMQLTSKRQSDTYGTFVSALDAATSPVCYKIGVGVASVAAVKAPKISVTPNPATESVSITGLDGTVAAEVVSATGSVMVSTVVGPGERIDVSGLPAGVYFVKAGKAVVKFVKH